MEGTVDRRRREEEIQALLRRQTHRGCRLCKGFEGPELEGIGYQRQSRLPSDQGTRREAPTEPDLVPLLLEVENLQVVRVEESDVCDRCCYEMSGLYNLN